MRFWLLDTGPIVAFLDAREAEHERVVAAFGSFTGRLVTTSAVVVEGMHFLGNAPAGAALLVEFLLASGIVIHECTSPATLTAAAELMAEYADTPMDFADATLVLLGGQLRTYSVCTLDRRGFRTYRTLRRKAFTLVLDE